MPPLARLGLSSRDHFGARSEQCTTWPPGTCSSQSRSSIEPSSSSEGGRSWCQVIIENGHCNVCIMQTLYYITSTTRHIWDGEKKKKRKQLLYHTDHIHCLAPWGVPLNKSHIISLILFIFNLIHITFRCQGHPVGYWKMRPKEFKCFLFELYFLFNLRQVGDDIFKNKYEHKEIEM